MLTCHLPDIFEIRHHGQSSLTNSTLCVSTYAAGWFLCGLDSQGQSTTVSNAACCHTCIISERKLPVVDYNYSSLVLGYDFSVTPKKPSLRRQCYKVITGNVGDGGAGTKRYLRIDVCIF
eukprot:NODE_10836_length_574_cov_97.263858_g10559_i0.p1 GENE.NODE_10836_length_574_cov_97.263858_g10559_i0~~NODE_10836_length_574_cov_97.263858_g10559_i0.p1  ORF type:complete len:120 (-),score=3.55 NODE_10836_length_574_cov_97.263858_g10559_i0:44-403(-)